MPKKYRYLLLFIGFIIFAVTSPLIIMYVQGVKFSKNNQKYTLTGIFAVKTNPKGAEIYLNNQLKGTAPINLRFIEPGEYDVTISKEGYQTWKKRLIAEEGKVTWVNPNPSEIFLFKQNPSQETISENVDNFLSLSKYLVLAQNNNLVIISQNNLANSISVPISEPILDIASNDSQNTLLVKTKNHVFLYDFSTNILKDVSSYVQNSNYAPGSYPYIYVLKKNNLNIINWKTGKSQLLWDNVSAFGTNQDAIYGLITSGNQSKLVASFLKDNFASTDTLISDLGQLNNPVLIPTQQKLIFVLNNNTLYRVGFSLEKIADNVTAYRYDATDGSLSFTLPGELDYYSFNDSQSKLISRTTEKFKDFFIKSNMAYSFYITDSKLEMRELDNRGGQNAYTLATSQDLKKTAINPDGNLLYYLDGKILKSLAIR